MGKAEATSCPQCQAQVSPGAKFCGSCGTPMDSSDMTGKVIADRFKVTAKLGEGGMGAVYRAEQTTLGRGVALKLLKPELANTPSLLKRFKAEAKSAANLNHPNTVTIYEFGQAADGALFIAMEYVEGTSLRQLIARGALPIDQALYITEQVCASLSDAHANGIVHRDLKPDNVMLTRVGKRDNVVKVLDFGIAKLRDDGRTTQDPMTQAGDLLGTPQYMAPEQIRGDSVDGRADVYALGCMLFEMITARLPFAGSTVMAILSKHLQDEPPAPSRVRPDLPIPPEIDRLILECLQKRPESRPPSMDDLGDRIADMRRRLGVPTPHHISTMTPGRPNTESGGQQASMAFTPTAAPTPVPAGGAHGARAQTPSPGPGSSTELPVGPPIVGGSLPGPGGPTGSAAQSGHQPPPGAAGAPPSAHGPHPGAPPSAHGPHPGAPPSVPGPHPGAPPSVPGGPPVAAASPTPAPASSFRATAPRRSGGRIGIWLLVGLLALGGIGAGVYFAVFRDSLSEDDIPSQDEIDDTGLPTDFDTKPRRKILTGDSSDDSSNDSSDDGSDDSNNDGSGGHIPTDFDTRPERDILGN